MKKLRLLLPGCIAVTVILTSCERRLSSAELKDNLEKTMTEYLQKEQDPNAAPLNFKMVDVSWFEEPAYYVCEFTVKLTRPDGTDTTGIIKSRISKDFSRVTKK
jgi:hypothetical protein